MGLGVVEKLKVDSLARRAIPELPSTAVATLEQMCIAIPKVVSPARLSEVERPAGVADQRGRTQVGAPIEPRVASSALQPDPSPGSVGELTECHVEHEMLHIARIVDGVIANGERCVSGGNGSQQTRDCDEDMGEAPHNAPLGAHRTDPVGLLIRHAPRCRVKQREPTRATSRPDANGTCY